MTLTFNIVVSLSPSLHLVDTIERLQASDKKKIYEQITKFLNKFHKFANEKIHENTMLFESYTNMSMSYLDVPFAFNKH